MTTIWALPTLEISDLTSVRESRPVALLTGERSWGAVSPLLDLPIVVQAEPTKVELSYLEEMASGLPPQAEVVYAVGGGLVADVAKYLGWARKIPVVLIPTALSVDGFFTPIVAARTSGSVQYVETGPAERIIVDWSVIRNAPLHVRGAAIVELLTITTGLLDWRYAAERNQNTRGERYQAWVAEIMASIARQAFKIADGVGKGDVDALRNLLDLLCLEVRITSQIGHTRPQEGSEQYFAYAFESRRPRAKPMPYADMVGPGILIGTAIHGQNVTPIRSTLDAAGVRLNALSAEDIADTIKILPDYVRKHKLPYSRVNDLDLTTERVQEIMQATGLG
ncbi:MAG: iron-containing alcohol dehydrogenase [bacterium]|nr:iron-containing alcohol dehydrogenase [bacterium]